MWFYTSSFGRLGAPPSEIILHDFEFCDRFFADGEEARSCNINGVLMYSSGKKVDSKDINGKEEKILNNSSSYATSIAVASSNIVKGQWTTDEDSLLIELVNHHGVGKWSHIVKKIVGRIGNQCRERWHNHLRPEIKKDLWSEAEEMLLVEAYKKIGNRWTEITKKILGRTKNSIKNHWNATKRRQNSIRKSKKISNQGKSSILQPYIKSMASNHDDTCTRKTAYPSTTPSSSPNQYQMMSPLLQPEPILVYDSSSMTTSSYVDERAHFMHSFMENFSYGYPSSNLSAHEESFNVVGDIQDPPLIDQFDFTRFNYDDVYECMGVVDEYIIDGLESSNVNAEVHQIIGDESTIEGKRDMDLMEIVLSFSNKSSSNINNNSF